jgi:UDP-3-O-[3-hydroxymyristoyl] glucosamine N-acyltransferase
MKTVLPSTSVADETAIIHPDATIDDGVIIGADTQVHDGAHIWRGCEIGERCTIGHNAHIRPGATLADDVSVGIGAIVSAGVRLIDGDVIPRGGNAKESPQTRLRQTEEAERIRKSAAPSNPIYELAHESAW